MKPVYKIWAIAAVCCVGIFISPALLACDPVKQNSTIADTSAAKKKQVKINNTPAVQPAKKQTAQKEEKRVGRDLVSPLPWFPTFVY